eukprot:352788-Chlamydomonas_euryale.AAC.3
MCEHKVSCVNTGPLPHEDSAHGKALASIAAGCWWMPAPLSSVMQPDGDNYAAGPLPKPRLVASAQLRCLRTAALSPTPPHLSVASTAGLTANPSFDSTPLR